MLTLTHTEAVRQVAAELADGDCLQFLSAASDGLALWSHDRSVTLWCDEKLKSLMGFTTQGVPLPASAAGPVKSPGTVCLEYTDCTGAQIVMECNLMKLQNGTWLVLHKNMSEQFRTEERLLALMAGKSALEEELEQFLYATSHDLQEPLRNIAEFAALLEVESGPNLSDDAQMCLDYIGKSTVRARQMIAGLLELSRTRRKKPQPVSIKVKELVQSLLVERAAACKTVAVDVDIDESCVILADFDLLSTVLSKLLDNALTYRRSDADHEVTITAARKRNRLEISVVDNGIGFDPVYQGEIFTIFRRLVPRSRYPGVGVGLSIAQAAARAMNGTVYSEGSPNKAVFSLSIPYSAR